MARHVQQHLLNPFYKIVFEEWLKMMIVGQISNEQEAKEMEFAAKCLLVGNRARILAAQIK